MQRHRRAAGFTMIEAIVTLGIFAIMVALGVPAMQKWVANNKVRAVSDNLQNGLRLAQAEALRRSRQVVFTLTSSTPISTTPFPLSAVANGNSWAIYTLPSMTDGSESPIYVDAGTLTTVGSTISVNSGGTVAICFNAAGRLISSSNAALATVIGTATCAVPTTGSPPYQKFSITATNADRNLQVNVALGGQVHMCDPHIALSAAYPEGCPP